MASSKPLPTKVVPHGLIEQLRNRGFYIFGSEPLSGFQSVGQLVPRQGLSDAPQPLTLSADPAGGVGVD